MKPETHFFLQLLFFLPKTLSNAKLIAMHVKVDPIHASNYSNRGLYLILKIFASGSGGFFTDSETASQFTFSCSWLGRGKKMEGRENKENKQKTFSGGRIVSTSHDIPESDLKTELQVGRPMLSFYFGSKHQTPVLMGTKLRGNVNEWI